MPKKDEAISSSIAGKMLTSESEYTLNLCGKNRKTVKEHVFMFLITYDKFTCVCLDVNAFIINPFTFKEAFINF